MMNDMAQNKRPLLHRHKETGFTLVELAIALMIIGLLIGGILKGEELVDNARIANVARQFNAYEVAVTTFRNTYQALPGDMLNPSGKLPGCNSTPCSTAGNSDWWIGSVSSYIELNEGLAKTGEYRNFWLHMAKAGLLTGINTNGTASPNPFQYGYELPAGPMTGTGFIAWSVNAGAPFNDLNSNLFVYVGRDGTNTGALSAKQAWALDRKIDDGKPYKGNLVIANHSTSYWGCATASDNNANYNMSLSSAACVVAYIMKY